MAAKADPLRWFTCHGRNGYDSPLAIDRVTPGQVAECLNVHLYGDSEMVTKRAGSSPLTLTGDAHSGINNLFRHVPGQAETAAEVFLIDNSGTTKILRVAGGTAKVNLTLMDTLADAINVCAVSLNGKLFFAYNSAVNRLHVFDPNYDTTSIRRVGEGTPAAATVANTGAGAYPATVRYYRIAFTRQVGGVTKQRSLLSASVSFTPSGAGTAARITEPASLSEGETHWEIYGSTDNALYYGPLYTDVVGSTTRDDSSTPSTWATSFSLSPSEGANTPFPSVKFLATDGNRLVGFGFWESAAGDSLTPKAGQVVFSPVLDTSGINDEERVSNTTTLIGTINISRNAGAEERGLVYFGDRFLAGFSRGIFALLPTGNDASPFRRVGLTRRLGFVNQQSICIGQDENGQEALYFLDPSDGPYRYTPTNGFQWCGKDVKDLWDTFNDAGVLGKAWAVYYADMKQVWFGIATGASDATTKILVLDVVTGRATESDGVRGGWTVYTGDLASTRCGAMLPKTIAATMTRALVPYVGQSGLTTILKYDPAVTSDNSMPFQAYIESFGFEIEPVFQNKAVAKSYVLGKAETGVTLTQTLIRNFGDETNRTDTVVMTAAGSETRLLKKFEASALVEAFAFQVRLGDSAAAANAWVIDRWYARVDLKEDR